MNKLIKKYRIILVAAIILLSGLSAGVIFNARADSIYDEFDELFKSTLSEILDYEDIEKASISAEKELLYDIKIEPLGLIYNFTYNNSDGFAILIYDGAPIVTELSTDAISPYQDNEDTKIYVMPGMYWSYDGNGYYDCQTGLMIDNDAIIEIEESAYFGSDFQLFYASENIYYTHRDYG